MTFKVIFLPHLPTFNTDCLPTLLGTVINDVTTIKQKFTHLLVSLGNDKQIKWQLAFMRKLGQKDYLQRIFYRKCTSNIRLILNKLNKTYLIKYQTGNLNVESVFHCFPLLQHGFPSFSSLFSL